VEAGEYRKEGAVVLGGVIKAMAAGGPRRHFFPEHPPPPPQPKAWLAFGCASSCPGVPWACPGSPSTKSLLRPFAKPFFPRKRQKVLELRIAHTVMTFNMRAWEVHALAWFLFSVGIVSRHFVAAKIFNDGVLQGLNLIRMVFAWTFDVFYFFTPRKLRRHASGRQRKRCREWASKVLKRPQNYPDRYPFGHGVGRDDDGVVYSRLPLGITMPLHYYLDDTDDERSDTSDGTIESGDGIDYDRISQLWDLHRSKFRRKPGTHEIRDAAELRLIANEEGFDLDGKFWALLDGSQRHAAHESDILRAE